MYKNVVESFLVANFEYYTCVCSFKLCAGLRSCVCIYLNTVVMLRYHVQNEISNFLVFQLSYMRKLS